MDELTRARDNPTRIRIVKINGRWSAQLSSMPLTHSYSTIDLVMEYLDSQRDKGLWAYDDTRFGWVDNEYGYITWYGLVRPGDMRKPDWKTIASFYERELNKLRSGHA